MQLSQKNDVNNNREKLYRVAATLAFITIFYNIIEGVVSLWFGASDEAFTLMGFGLDSFVEVISGAGILHMVRRQMSDRTSRAGPFRTAGAAHHRWGFLHPGSRADSNRPGQHLPAAPADDHPLGDHHRAGFHRFHVVPDPRQGEGRNCARLTRHPGRRRLHQGLSLSVAGPPRGQRRLCADRHRLFRFSRHARNRRVFAEGSTRGVPQGKGGLLWLRGEMRGISSRKSLTNKWE